MAGRYDESMARDLSLIREVFVGSGININANFTIDDRVGINDTAGNPLQPASQGDINNLRLDTARIVQPSGQRVMANSASVVIASDNISTVSVTQSGIALTAATSVQSGVTVSTSSVLVVGLNTLRKSLIISNIGTSGLIYLGPTNAVTSGTADAGIVISSQGSFSESVPGIFTGTIWGICDSPQATQNLSIWERT